MTDLVKIFVAAFLINNIILMRFIALCSYIGMTSDVGQSVGMGLAVTFVTVMASAVTWPIYYWILKPNGLEFLEKAAGRIGRLLDAGASEEMQPSAQELLSRVRVGFLQD